MIGKQIFINRSLKDDSLGITKEVVEYIDHQQKSGRLGPEFYNDSLLYISEFLPYIKDKESWIDFGYQYCRYLKQSIENSGYISQTAMFGGLGYECFAVNAFCQEANVLLNFSRNFNKLLFFSLDNRLNQIKDHPTYDSNYDIINGISGNLYYLLDCDYDQNDEDTIVKCLEYLLGFTADTIYDGKAIISFHILQPNQNSNFNQRDFKNGSINFGLAHGMIGPLIALAKAHAKGFRVEGLRKGIEKVYQLYEIFQVPNDNNIPYWPDKITVEEYWDGQCRSENLHRACSWCYGNIGILRGLQKVAGYMNWLEREREYIEAMKRFLTQEIKEYSLLSPSLCHGFSSVVAIQISTYTAYRDPMLLTNLERNVHEIVTGYRKNNEREVSLIDIRNETIWIEGYLKDLSLLTGSTGIATTLLSLQGTTKTGKLLMID